MTAKFPHHSRPGHFSVSLDEGQRRYLATIASALVPGDGEYPTGGAAQVDLFICERASDEDAGRIASIASRWPATTVAEAVQNLTAMETEDPVAFVYLRELVYHGYYSSRRVLAAMVDRGYRYHGAPQPLGYPRTEELLTPAEPRGSFIATGEVTRVPS